MTALRALAELESKKLDELSASHSHLMIRLVHTECLLQLARLSTVELDLASYVKLVMDTLEQFLPLRWCRLVLDVEDVPHIDVSRGPVGAESLTSTLGLGDTGHGHFTLALDHADLAPIEFVAAVAEQISHGIRTVARAEQLRREAARAEAGRLISSIEDPVTEADVQRIVSALSYLPNILGIELTISHPIFERTLSLSAGLSGTAHEITLDIDEGFCDLCVAWASPPSASNRDMVVSAATGLVASLDRIYDHRRLTAEAQTDALTGLANRRRGEHDLRAALDWARSAGGTVALACLDLDHFKQLNDRFGHPVGDQVLVRFGAHLQAVCRQGDSVARTGGEEFQIVYTGQDRANALRSLTRVVDGVPAACRTAAAPEWVQTVSVGLACFPEDADTPEELVAAADVALYKAKASGRNRIEV